VTQAHDLITNIELRLAHIESMVTALDGLRVDIGALGKIAMEIKGAADRVTSGSSR